MEKKPIFNVNDVVYYIQYNRIIEGEITAVIAKDRGDFRHYEYQVDGKEMSENKISGSKAVVIRKVLAQLHLEEDKIHFICKTLFPEEYQEENSNELTEEDFEKLETKEETLQIPEKSSFFRNLFK